MTGPRHLPAARRRASPLRAGSLCTGYGGLDLAVTAVLEAALAWCAETDRHAAASWRPVSPASPTKVHEFSYSVGVCGWNLRADAPHHLGWTLQLGPSEDWLCS